MTSNFILTTITCSFCGKLAEKLVPRREETRRRTAPHGHFCDQVCAKKARYRRKKARYEP